MKTAETSARVLVIGTGAAGLAAAVRLHALGMEDVLVCTEGLDAGTSINTGSDKQTYYKLSLDGARPDSPLDMARDLAAGGAVHGDIALVEAALSPIAFANLVALGVEFPHDAHGLHTGYRTDHDTRGRATSAGPYTSRDMCRALIAECRRRRIDIREPLVAVDLLSADSPSGRRVAGAVFIDPLQGGFLTIRASAVVFATGGPGGLYGRSVYPPCHTGGIGLALAIGAEARNLAESQFGLASTAFRWNVSGSYMQVVPRVFSLDSDGVEREFLSDDFGSPAAAFGALFLKGYQWPFSAGNAAGSSLVDIFVNRQTLTLSRRVFLDFRRNPDGFRLDALPDEAADYLARSGALLAESPLARLEAMNPGAIRLYRDHGIDLAAEPLEIDVCAQHNNGGLAADIWWQSTNVSGLFPIGEVNGSHGIVRPGGSALNAGQVGAWRAAERIARGPAFPPPPPDALPSPLAPAPDAFRRPQARSWRTVREGIHARMDRAAGFLRRKSALDAAVEEAREDLRDLLADGLSGLDPYDLAESLRNRALAFAHVAYLEACRLQVERSGSRGGSIAIDPAGRPLSPLLGDDWRILPEAESARAETTVCSLGPDASFHARFEPCRPVPEANGWFEAVWRDYRNRAIYG